MESQMNMDTIRSNIKYIMLGMITAGTVDMITAGTVDMITAGTVDMITEDTVGMPTIITEALRNFS